MEKAEHTDREPMLLGEALGTVLDGIRCASRAAITVDSPVVLPLWRRNAHQERQSLEERARRERREAS